MLHFQSSNIWWGGHLLQSFVTGLFHNTLSALDYTASNDWKIRELNKQMYRNLSY